MGDDIGSGLSFIAVCFDFRSTNVVQLSNRNPYFYRFWCHHQFNPNYVWNWQMQLQKDLDNGIMERIEHFTECKKI